MTFTISILGGLLAAGGFGFTGYVLVDYLNGMCSGKLARVYAPVFAVHGLLGLYISIAAQTG